MPRIATSDLRTTNGAITVTEVSAWILIAAQVAHGFTPARTGTHTVVGPVVGLVLLVASVVAAIGIRRRKPWGRRVLGWTGIVVALGFSMYHALPFHSAFTNPYVGKSVGLRAWLGVAIAVAAAVWAAFEGVVRGRS